MIVDTPGAQNLKETRQQSSRLFFGTVKVSIEIWNVSSNAQFYAPVNLLVSPEHIPCPTYKNCHSLVSCVHWCTKIWYDLIQRYMEINQSMDRYLYYYLSHCHQVYTSRTLFSLYRYFAKRFYGPVLFAQWQTAKNLTMKVISNQICKSLVSHNTIFDISILRSPNVPL